MKPPKMKIIVLIIALFCINVPAFASNLRSDMLLDELPSVIIAYSLFSSYYQDFKSLWSSNEKPWFLDKLQAALSELNCDIDLRLAFTHESYIVRSNTIRTFLSVDSIKSELKSVLFVTTPIKSYDNKILVILSSVSPERTTIIAIDNELGAELLYDSFNLLVENVKMCSIHSIRIEESDSFILEEKSVSSCPMTNTRRSFSITFPNGTFKLERANVTP